MKKTNSQIRLLRASWALILLSAFGASAGAQDRAITQKIGADQRGVLSAATNNRLHLAETGASRRISSPVSSQQLSQQLIANRASHLAEREGNLVPVNNAAYDFALSRLAGFSQNGSSNAWCGQNIVVGYNDSFAYLYTLALGVGASFSGVAVSHDAGASFQALPFLAAGSSPNNFLSGEPVIVCAGKAFYYASLFQFQNSAGQFVSAVGVNRSTDGGDTWSHPIPAVGKNADNHIIDKEWLAVDPNNPSNLYLSFTDFDYTFSKNNGCGGTVRIAIELAASNNGGLSWTKPTAVAQLCNAARGQALQASQVTVGNAGEVFVAYVAETSIDEQIVFRRSNDGGQTFSDPIPAASAMFAGLGGVARLQGLIQAHSFPSLSIDRSRGASRGTLYLTWTDASRHQIPDFLAPTQTYGFGEIMFSKSTDHGRTWTPAAPVRPLAAHRDQFLPSGAVDRDGALTICYFDRRRDPENNGVDHYCSVSHDQGASFTHLRNTPTSFAPTHFTDGLMDPVNFGDYDIVSSDSTGANTGFFSTFQTQSAGDPNIVGVRF
jgi:hypothetical protein